MTPTDPSFLETLTVLASTISLGFSATTLVLSLGAAIVGGLAGALTFRSPRA